MNKKQSAKLGKAKKHPRKVWARVGNKLRQMDNGRVPAPGLGIFVVRTITKDVDGHAVPRKQIRLRLKDPGAGTAQVIAANDPES
jgi:hypothetical protein